MCSAYKTLRILATPKNEKEGFLPEKRYSKWTEWIALNLEFSMERCENCAGYS
jgi:hypothetical protein